MKRRVRDRNQVNPKTTPQPVNIGRAVLVVLVLTPLIGMALQNDPTTISISGWAIAVLLSMGLGVGAYYSALILGLVILPIIAALLINTPGVYLGLSGAFVWLMAAVTTTVLVFVYFGRSLLPDSSQYGTTTATHMLMQYVLREIIPQKPFSIEPNLKMLPPSFERFGAGILPSHQLLVLEKGVSFTRPHGPGFVRIEPKEAVVGVIDLREYWRQASISAVTRDGITVKTSIAVLFHLKRVQPAANPTKLQLPYHYQHSAIFETFYATTIVEDETQIQWYSQIVSQAAGYLVRELAVCNLDQLYKINDTTSDPLGDICEGIKKDLAKDFKSITILSVTVSRIKAPDDIMSQRLDYWKKVWEKQIKTAKEAQKLGKGVKLLDEETAKAQMQVIEELTQNIDTLIEAGDAPFRHEMSERMKAVLQRTAAQGALSILIPPMKEPDKKKEEKKKPDEKKGGSG